MKKKKKNLLLYDLYIIQYIQVNIFFLHKLIVYYMTVTYNKKEGSGHFCKL